MIILLVSLLTSFSHAATPYPTVPDPRLTTGSLCQRAEEVRYPERIKYCGRHVSPHQKDIIIQNYEKLGYQVRRFNRNDFKIDHMVPLCAGGSNEMNNLWPQHKSVYAYTDPLESVGCQKLSMGRIKQAALIELFFQAKRNPPLSQKIYQMLNSL